MDASAPLIMLHPKTRKAARETARGAAVAFFLPPAKQKRSQTRRGAADATPGPITSHVAAMASPFSARAPMAGPAMADFMMAGAPLEKGALCGASPLLRSAARRPTP